MVKAY